MITQMIKKLYFVIAILVFALTYAQRIGIGSHSFDDSEILKIASSNNQSFVGSERPTMKLLLNGSFGSFFNTMGLS